MREVAPFNHGDKVVCIKQGEWRDFAGLGEIKNNCPVFGQVYTVEYVAKPTPDYKGQPSNGVEWAMTLKEFPHSDSNPHVYSCRRFKMVTPSEAK